jgi:hypothetical protein
MAPAAGPTAVYADHEPPLRRADFRRTGEQGFGDRNNSWPWAMKWWKGRLYVGTNRAYSCASDWELHRVFPQIFPYPAADPTQNCRDYPTPADLPIAAEIWRWTPGVQMADAGTWDRVYQSPQDVPNPDPAFAGKFVPREYGFRTAEAFTEPGGVDALYFGGVHTRAMWTWDASDNFPPPRFVRTTDGETFTGVPHASGTFLGSLPSNSFRGLAAYNNGTKNQLFALHGTILGSGFLIASDNPAAGNDAWQRVSPDPVEFWDLEVFNGWLYGLAVNFQGQSSYTVVKTRADGPPPYQFQVVVPSGGYSNAQYALSMAVHEGRLYVGTVEPTEIIRINADDTWELVMGTPRQRPDGTWLYPLSGLDEGFNNGFNDHLWRMASSDGQLYAGTYDASIQYKFYNQVVQASRHLFGADLLRTSDGWYFTPITLNGFGDPFALGLRNFADTPFGLFAGLADDSFGLNMYRGIHGSASPPVAAPTHLETEQTGTGIALTWDPSLNAARYHVYAAPIVTIKVPRAILKPRLPTSTPTSVGSPAPRREEPDQLTTVLAGRGAISTNEGITLPPPRAVAETTGPFDWFFMDVKIPTPYREVGVTEDTVFVHATGGAGTNLYLVFAEDAQGRWSESSNLALGPSLQPPMTFGRVQSALAEQARRGRAPGGAEDARRTLDRALTAAGAGNHAAAISELESIRREAGAGRVATGPDQADVDVMVAKLMDRVRLARQGLISPTALR